MGNLLLRNDLSATYYHLDCKYVERKNPLFSKLFSSPTVFSFHCSESIKKALLCSFTTRPEKGEIENKVVGRQTHNVYNQIPDNMPTTFYCLDKLKFKKIND